MRRMITTQQLNYINELSQVAEKGFKVGTYPATMNIDGIFNLQRSIYSWDESEEIDFDTHTVATGAYYFFEYSELWEHYGLSETGGEEDVGYVAVSTEAFSFPENINTIEDLEKYLESPTGQESLATLLDNNDVTVEETMLNNLIANYNAIDFGGFLIKNGQLTAESTALECLSGEGEEIINAPDPIGVDTLKTNYLQAENIKPWYFIQGNLTDISGDVNYNIIPQVAVRALNGKYIVTAIKWETSAFYDVLYGYNIDFATQKIYDPNNTEIEPDLAEIYLINALTGEIVKDIQI